MSDPRIVKLSQSELDKIDMSGAGLAQKIGRMEQAPYAVPNPNVETIGVMLAGVPLAEREALIEAALVVWLREAGIIKGLKLLVPKAVLAMHGQHIHTQTPEGNRYKCFMWDDKPVILAIYH
jgi:hypothetical protein